MGSRTGSWRKLQGLLLAALLVLQPFMLGGVFGQSSGGYSLPRSGGGSRPSGGTPGYGGGMSGGDRAISRRSASNSLGAYRAPVRPLPPPVYGYGGGSSRPAYGGTYGSGLSGISPSRPQAAPSYGWAQPGRNFGVWDGLMLFGLLNSLSNASSARFFQNNRDDPGYRQWRAEADRSADTDPALRTRLVQLDQQLAQAGGTSSGPVSSGKPPPLPDLPLPDLGPRPEAPRGGGWLVYVLLLGGAALFALLWLLRRRRAACGAAPAALGGSPAQRFRVGMTFPFDPTPFVLAANATKVRGPEAGGMISVEAVGVLMDGATALHRLYLPGREGFFLLHLGADGRADECRYFSRLDEVTPGSRDDWAAWLDPARGMLGWPQFQTRDGVLYDRVWSPGPNRTAPRDMTETIRDTAGTTSRKLSLMLYGKSTGLAAPAPASEYMLVAAVEAAGEAFIEIHAGLDINPASLTLPSVKL